MTAGTIPTMDATAETRYAHGTECTWHNYLSAAAITTIKICGDAREVPRCPHCGCVVQEIPLEAWLDGVACAAQRVPEAGLVMAWSRGKCFPDQDTMVNAYRQAMEE